MSQISGALNSISTLVSYDLFKRYKPEINDRQLVVIGKISAGIALLLSLVLLPLLNQYESLFNGINDVIAHIAPPITTVFILGVFWKKASAKAAQYTLWFGSALGAGVFMINKLFPDTLIGHTPFMMMAFYLFIACIVIQVSLSYYFPVHHTEESKTLFWKSPWEPLQDKGWKGMGNYKVLSILLLGVMIVLYSIFY